MERKSSASIIFVLLITIHCVTAQSDGIPPVILPNQADITVLPSETVKFTCQSTEPIHWIFHELYVGQHQISEKYSNHNDYTYESTLELLVVDYTYVGFYQCVKNASAPRYELDGNISALLQDGEAAQIYLFVEDPQHPLVEMPLPFIEANQNENVTIPCKPTSKQWKTQLIKEGDESHQFNSTFNPTQGYTILVKELTDGGYYTCHSKFDTTGEHDIHFSVHVNSGTKFVNKPIIVSKTENYGIEGKQLELTCSVECELGTKLTIRWELPNEGIAEKEGRTHVIQPIHKTNVEHPELFNAVGGLVVNHLDRFKDVGIYKCTVDDHSYNRNSAMLSVVQILGPNESFINITEPSERYESVVTSSKKEAKWLVKYAGHPFPSLVWRDLRGNEIPWSSIEDKNRKYEATKDNRSTTLKIRNPKITDSGFYTLYADNGQMQKEQKFRLLVKEKPQTSMTSVSIKPNEKAVLNCDIFGYPTSEVTWSYIPCSNFEFDAKSCNESNKQTFTNHFEPGDKEDIQTMQRTTFNQTSTLTFTPDSTGIVICSAKNTQGSGETTANVIVNDLNEDLSIWSENELPISVGDQVSIICGASAHKYANELHWYKDDVLISGSNNMDVHLESTTAPDMQVIPHDTPYSHRKELRWNAIASDASGKYVCRANVIKDDSPEEKTWQVTVVEPKVPEIEEINFENGKSLKHLLGEPLQLRCKFSGIPRPKVTWFKDGDEITSEGNNSRIAIREDNTLLDIHFIKGEDDGEYKCVAQNRLGSSTRQAKLKITNMPLVSRAVIIGVVVIILVLVICTVYLCLRIRRERRLFRELKAAGLANFEEGNIDSINPDLTLDEQADLLPYDKKYEFPRDKLKLGKQLGAGAFGIVIKGIAQGIVPHEDETTVAVKMVKKMADNDVMRALISELKIMVHLGQHLNVVNLLGAVTKNIAQREVMVIVEYCRFGNLQNFLVKHRNYFIDQIVRDKDIIDPSILTRDPRWSNDSGYSFFNRPEADRQSVVNSAYIRHANASDYFPGGMDSANTEATLLSRNTIPGGEDNVAMSNNSTQPAWRSNYQSDYKGPSRSVTTTDLLCWAFQVSRGMHYLASRKVLHGDLAARNILLCDDNVVKICDFGLARSMYKTDNYHKKGESPLPFKWLAIESISDQVFSTYSDVWSFGIVLWELFSLGKVPYPGMEADQALYFKLRDGYRMEKPDYATQDIYDIMLSCWCANAESRPLFDELERNISRLLENGVAEHYIDLNEPYLKSNISHINAGQTDYLALMGAPDCQAPCTPNNYVNSHIISMQQAPSAPPMQPNYMEMSPPVNINSPLPDGADAHDSHFAFAINSPTVANNLNTSENSLKLRNKISNIPEEIPMLKRSNQSFHSDSDSELNTSDELAKNSSKQNALNSIGGDNYVNVPSTVINTSKKDAVSNPGYIVVTNVNETRT